MNKTLNMEQFKETIHSVHAGNYDLTVDEMNLLREICNEDLCNLVYDSYRWGFLKGIRSEKTKQKKVRTRKAAALNKEA